MMFRDIMVTFGGQVGRVLFATAGAALLARGLGVEDRGIYALAVCLPFILMPISQFGQMEVNSVFAGRHSDKRKALFVQTLMFGLIFGLAGCGIMLIFFCLPVNKGGFDSLPYHLVLLSSLLIPIQALDNMLRELARGAKLISATVLVTTLGQALRAAALLFFVFLAKMGLDAAIWITLLAPVATIAGYIWIVRDFATLNMKHLSWPLVRESLRFGSAFVVSSSAMIMIQRVATILLAYMSFTDRDIGLYAVALMFGMQIGIVPTSVAQAFLPQLSNHPEERLQQTPMIFRLTLIACFVTTIGLLLLCYPLIVILAGENYVDCIPALSLMLPGLTFFGATRVLGMYLWAIKKPQYGMVNNCIVLCLTIVLSGLFIPAAGIEGAAAAFSFGLLVLGGLTIWAYRREAKVSMKDLIPGIVDCKEISAAIKKRLIKLTGKRRLRPNQ